MSTDSNDENEEQRGPAAPGDAPADTEGPSSDVAATLADADGLDDEARRRIREEVARYQESLEQAYRRASDRPIIKKRRRTYLDRLIEHELAEEERDLEEVRADESDRISWNLKLSLIVVILFTGAALSVSDQIQEYAGLISGFFTKYFSWFYMLVSAGSLIFLLYLALSRFGSVVLGEPDQEPEFSDLSWYSMLFSAGMGVGLLFNGGAEPLMHFLEPPIGNPGTVEAARRAMTLVCFHWGLNAWAIYTVCAVAAAYYGFRKKKKYLVSSSIVDLTESPTLERWMKIASDLVATLAVIFGVAASIGMGVKQLAGGLAYCYDLQWASTGAGQAGILVVVTVLFILSASTGLEKGIKLLSNLNMGVAVLLMLFVLAFGPTLFQLKLFVDTLGEYIADLPRLSFNIAPFTADYERWMGKWTLAYFTWWIAWAPFVGIFIARISRGRTIRELVMGSLIVPTLFSVLWFSVFGGAALHLELYTDKGIGTLVQTDITTSLFALLELYPMHQLTWFISLLLILTFLVTSADSACFVIAMMTTEGDLEPSSRMKLMWGAVLAVLTWILLQGGGLAAIQAAALTSAFPFSLVMILMVISVRIRLAMQVEQSRI